MLNFRFTWSLAYFFGVIIILWSLPGEPLHAQPSDNPVMVSGQMNLGHWDFEKQGQVSLAGKWQFFWNQFIPPGQINFEDPGKNTHWIPIPGSWNRFTGGGKQKGGQGYATLALRVVLGNSAPPLSLSIRKVMTAYDVFINGKQTMSVGKTGMGTQSMIPEYRPVIIDLPPNEPFLDIVIHVSNFNHRLGGIKSKIIMGSRKTLKKNEYYRLAINSFAMGSIFIMGLYHLILYFLRKRYVPPLYLGIFCCLVTIRSIAANEQDLMGLLPLIPWEFQMRIDFLGFYLGVPAFFLFISSLFPHEVSKKIQGLVLWVAVAFSLAVILFPARIYSHSAPVFQIFTVLVCCYVIWVFAKVILNRGQGIWALLLGFLALFASVVNDMLYASDIIQTGSFIHAGMFAFILSQALILSLQFSKTFHKVEQQKQTLTREIKNKETLENELIQSHDQFENSRIALILGLAKLAEYRDTDTGAHLERIREYTRIVATDLADTESFQSYISPEYIQDIYHSAILHDIGKIGIKDEILLKPGKLTKEEFNIMKTHTLIGGDTINDVESKVKIRSFLTLGKEIAYYHHEKWDGSGYPKGLSGEDIPLCARITAIADVYDALTSERPYKKAFSHEKALKIIVQDSGSHFDPEIVAAFLRQADKIRQIKRDAGNAPQTRGQYDAPMEVQIT